jgi:alpha-amylase/alpha-mannosidase (GH57 family)
MNCFLCIHGHFYQPPRENPWLDTVLCEPSAAPYHDWNQKIARECYGPNAAARIPDGERGILSLVNNYEYMSFNFGPTLLTWLSRNDPWVYERIIEADRMSVERYHGHGNAIAQVYNHIIMPLASRRNKRTQIIWGIEDFKYRFGRMPEGMWLAETAVDNETLSLMAGEGIRFTILSPDQAEAVRPFGSAARRPWKATNAGMLDTTIPYRVFPEGEAGNFIDVFFYNGPVSQGVAYEKLLASGEQFLTSIKDAANNGHAGPRMITVATDGESYGHHSKFGEMALAWLFKTLGKSQEITVINPGAFLERFPPEWEAKIRERSSWSCAHGVERWRSDCGCNVTGTPGWNQAWRTPLRDALEHLSDSLDEIFETTGQLFFENPWEARDDYVRLLIDPSVEARNWFLEKHVRAGVNDGAVADAMRLLESQRMGLFMFTSCGWFFDDISGLEAVQIMLYAARGVDLVGEWAEENLEARLKEDLSRADSNIPGAGTGADIYEKSIGFARMAPPRLAAHVVCAGVPVKPGLNSNVFSCINRGYEIENLPGASRGIVRVAEPYVPGSHEFFSRRTSSGCEIIPLDRLAGSKDVFDETMPGAKSFLCSDLIPDVLHEIAGAAGLDVEKVVFGALEEPARRLMDIARLIDARERYCVPKKCLSFLGLAASYQITKAMSRNGGDGGFTSGDLEQAVKTAVDWELPLDREYLAEEFSTMLSRFMKKLSGSPGAGLISGILEILDAIVALDLPVDLWAAQNMYYDMKTRLDFNRDLPEASARSFEKLGRRLGFRKY